MRIGVLREYMRMSLLAKADEESIGLVDKAIADLRALGATIVDPGPEGELFTRCITRYAPELLNSAFARQYPQLFPAPAPAPASGDQIATLLDLQADPTRVPAALSLRSLNAGGFGATGEGKYTPATSCRSADGKLASGKGGASDRVEIVARCAVSASSAKASGRRSLYSAIGAAVSLRERRGNDVVKCHSIA